MSDADDREAVDRAFAELVAGYHLTADRPDPPSWDRPVIDTAPEAGSRFEPPAQDPEPGLLDLSGLIDLPSPAQDDAVELPEERFEPEPPPPLSRPAWPVLVGWIGLGYAMLTILAIAVGVNLPTWAAWAGVIGFVGGFGLLVSRLPRQRPPDAGDGAVL
jgi:hypothetical protein